MSETIDILMELLNEYRESGCALDEERVSWYAARFDSRLNVLNVTLKRLGRAERGLGDLERRIEVLERKLNHKGGNE